MFLGKMIKSNSSRPAPFSSIILIIIFAISTAIVSCNKSEEVVVENVKPKETQSISPKKKESLVLAMKKASRVMRRLSRAVENNDWVEIDMWAQELKEGIGYNCVELYMNENPGISSEFVVLGNKFYSNINKLLLSSEKRLKPVTDFQFSMIIKSCDDCHERFYAEVGREMQFTDQVRILLNKNNE